MAFNLLAHPMNDEHRYIEKKRKGLCDLKEKRKGTLMILIKQCSLNSTNHFPFPFFLYLYVLA